MRFCIVLLLVPWPIGCAAMGVADLPRATLQDGPQKPKEANGKEDKDDKDEAKKPKRPPKTLFEWQVGPEQEDKEEDEADEPLATDRPDFVEASSNVGLGRIQLESGYTFSRDRNQGANNNGHSYPEMLLRMGVIADWLELRIGQNFGNERSGDLANLTTADGAEDLYLGLAFALTEQKGPWPESRIIFQTTVPTGSKDLTANKMLPGFNYLYGWDVVPDLLTFAGSTQVNKRVDDSNHGYVEIAQAFTTGISFTKKFGMYLEAFALMPTSAYDPGTGPEYYCDSGFTYKVTINFQLDIRAGIGLNRHAQDFFTGAGFAVRY